MTKMTKRIGAAMLSTALLLGALTGCGGNTSSSTDGDNAASTSTENPHITVVLKTLASEYWAYVAKGCELRLMYRVRPRRPRTTNSSP